MKNIGKILKRTAAAALCAAGLLSLTGCEKNYSKMMNEAPAEYISMAYGNTADAMSPLEGSGELFKKAAEDGAVTLSCESDGITFKSEAALSEKDSAFSQLMTMTGASGKSAQIYAYAGKNGAKIGAIGQSGSHIYDITYEGIAEKLAASIFAPESGTYYAMSQSDYDELTAYINQMSEAVKSAANGEAQDDEYSKIFTDYFDTHKPEVQEKTDADIGGETVSSNIITYTIPTEDVKSLANQVFETAMADEKVKEQLTEYYDEETLRESFNDLMDALDECGITAAYYINAKTNVMMKSDFTVNITVDEQPIKVYVNSFFGADPAAADVQTFDAGADIAGETVSFNMAKVRTDNGWLLKASTDLMGEKTDLFTVSFEKTDKNYTLVIQSPGDVVAAEVYAKIEGTVDISKTAFDMTVDKITYNDSDTDMLELEPKAKVNVKIGGEISVLDAEKELFDITEEEMDALLDELDKDIGAIIEEADGSGAMGSYVKSSRLTQANANAKNVHTACTATVVQEYVDGNEYSGAIEGSPDGFTIGGKKIDVSQYLGPNYFGYAYGYVNESTFSVEYTMWSQDPIPDEYKHQLTKEEQDKLAGEKIFIGCFPVPQSEGLIG